MRALHVLGSEFSNKRTFVLDAAALLHVLCCKDLGNLESVVALHHIRDHDAQGKRLSALACSA